MPILIDDPDYLVRIEVVKQKYRLDKLISDENSIVRRAVAKQRYGLDILVNDPYWYVRVEVACQGYGLNKLIHDPCKEVSDIAKLKLIEKVEKEQPGFLDKLAAN